MKLEVGMYVRTEYGEIGKIRTIIDNMVFINTNQYYSTVIKASHNIIDLIEVGDYVNGMRIDDIDIHSKRLYREMRYDYEIIDGKEIKSIVTKEQFEAIKYEVK